MDQIDLLQQTAFQVRAAQADDVPACLELDAAYQTDYVWQMNFREEDRAVNAAFSQVRLPRSMDVESPCTPQVRAAMLQTAQYLLVACRAETIIGCLAGSVAAWNGAFAIDFLVIEPGFRRRGAAKLLLNAAKEAAAQESCNRLLLTVQTKNYPAIQFAQERGFAFCGYNDKFFPNGDIALNFSLAL